MLRQLLTPEQRAARALTRALDTPLLGFRGSWKGNAQSPLRHVPCDVLAQALDYFTRTVATLVEITEARQRAAMRYQIDMITRVLSAPAVVDEAIRFRVVCAWCSRVESIGTPNALTSHTICSDCVVTFGMVLS